jgi:4-hydroxy-tetrahydrodipicolinate synthase
MQFSGIYTPVITPFHDDGSIDEGGFAQVVEFLIDAGVHGIVVAGTTGEYYAQTYGRTRRPDAGLPTESSMAECH